MNANACVNTRRLGVFTLVVASALLLVSCNSSKDVALAEAGVTQFHAQFDQGHFPSMYAASDTLLRGTNSEAKFAAFLDAVYRKLGPVRSSSLKGWNINWHTGTGETVALTYQTGFSYGSGTEHFLWHISNHHATLVGYHINSDDLVLK